MDEHGENVRVSQGRGRTLFLGYDSSSDVIIFPDLLFPYLVLMLIYTLYFICYVI